MKSTNLTKCSRSWSPKCLMMGSTLRAKWNPQTRQSFRLSFKSSTCCKTELQHAQTPRAQTQHAHVFHQYAVHVATSTPTPIYLLDGRRLAPLPNTEDPVSFSPTPPPLRSSPPFFSGRRTANTCLYAQPLTLVSCTGGFPLHFSAKLIII